MAMGLILFDDIPRTDPSPASGQEDSFTFMNRVHQPYWAEIRCVLEDWYRRFPADEAVGLRKRFRSRRPGQHWSAWWELYLHELFSCLDFEITPHPPLPDTSRTPDFEISRGGLRAYLEATVVFSGIVAEEPEAPAWLLDAVNLSDNAGFFVLIDSIESAGGERLRNIQVSKPIQEWLDGLDPDQVSEDYKTKGELPEYVLDERGWRVRFSASPVKPEARGKPGHRVLAGGPPITGMVDDVEQLHDKLKSKAGRYGRPEVPIITAVLCASSFMEQRDIAQALFGRDAIQLTPSPTGGPPQAAQIRQRNGFWMHESGPQNRRVSAVLTAVQLHPWTCTKAAPTLWFNPWADHELSDELPFPIATATDRGRVTHTIRELDMAAVLGLPRDWPGGVPFPKAA